MIFAAFGILGFVNIPAYATEGGGIGVRPSVGGQLFVDSTDLVDRSGERVFLKGVRLHGLTWFPEFINEQLFEQVSREWNANMIRLPLYTSMYLEDKKESLSLVRKGIEAAISADMYVIVDWHVLEDKDPNVHKEEAREFFTTIVSEYANVPNVIYEICNEPNGETTWSDVREYAYDYMTDLELFKRLIYEIVPTVP